MHLRRVRAFKLMEDAGLLTFERYTPEDGYMVVTRADDRREVSSMEAVAYLIGSFDLYQAVRQCLDEVAGEEALAALDDRFLEVLDAACSPFTESAEVAS